MSKLAAIETDKIGSGAHAALVVVAEPIIVPKGATTELVPLWSHTSIRIFSATTKGGIKGGLMQKKNK